MGTDPVTIINAGAERIRKGKNLIGKDITKQFSGLKPPGAPELPALPERPEFDAALDKAKSNALMERIRKQSIRGRGVQDTIRTSARGVLDRANIGKKRLTGV